MFPDGYNWIFISFNNHIDVYPETLDLQWPNLWLCTVKSLTELHLQNKIKHPKLTTSPSMVINLLHISAFVSCINSVYNLFEAKIKGTFSLVFIVIHPFSLYINVSTSLLIVANVPKWGIFKIAWRVTYTYLREAWKFPKNKFFWSKLYLQYKYICAASQGNPEPFSS